MIYNIRSNADDDSISSFHGTYANARSGSGASFTLAGGLYSNHGQIEFFGYQCHIGYLRFDTSGVVGTVTDVKFKVYGNTIDAACNQVSYVKLHTWTSPVDSTDWVDGSTLSSKTLLATYQTNPNTWKLNSYNDFTSTPAFKSSINQSGYTYVIVTCDKTENSTLPTTGVSETASYITAEDTDRKPTLVVCTDESVLPISPNPKSLWLPFRYV